MLFTDTESGVTLPEANDFISKLVPNWISFLVQLIALIVIIVVVIIFAYKPVKKIIEKRQEYIENNIRESEINKATSIENARQSEQLIIASNKQADLIVQEAKSKAIREREILVNETDKMIEAKKLQAEKDIEQAKLEAKESIRKEMVNLAIDASEEILKREVNKDDNTRIAKDFIRSANE